MLMASTELAVSHPKYCFTPIRVEPIPDSLRTVPAIESHIPPGIAKASSDSLLRTASAVVCGRVSQCREYLALGRMFPMFAHGVEPWPFDSRSPQGVYLCLAACAAREPRKMSASAHTSPKIRPLIDREMTPGSSEVTWDGRNQDGAAVGTGMYFARMVAGGTSHVVRVPLVR